MRWSQYERTAHPAWRRFGVTILVAVLACSLSVAMEPWFEVRPLVPLYGAVAVGVWYGGVSSAVLAAILSIVGYGLFVGGPVGQWSITANDTPRFLSFAIFTVLLSVLSAGRDRTENALLASERRFRTMLETANEGVWLFDRDARTQYANDRMALLLGTTPERVMAGGFLDFIFPGDETTALARIGANLDGRAEEFDFRFRRADGLEVLVLAGTSPVRDGTGRIVGALGLFTDVTARRYAEAGLGRANQRFALAADAVQSLIYEWDLQTDQVERSAGLLPLIGYRPDEAPDNQAWWHARIHPDDRGRIPIAAWRHEPDTDRYSQEYRIRHRDGRWVTVWDQGRIVRDEGGQPARIIGSATDITGRSEAEQALRLLDEAGRTLASSLDYEETLQRVAWFSVPSFVDWCVVDLLDAQGIARRVAVAHADPEQAGLAARLRRYPASTNTDGPEERVVRTGEPLFVKEVPDTLLQAAAQNDEHLEILRATGVLSVAVLPLRVGGEVYGAISMATTVASDRRLNDEDFALAEQLARRSAVAIQNARLFRDAQAAEARYRGLFEGTKDAMLVFDRGGICLDVNPALLEMVGYDRQELVGNMVSQVARGGPWSGEEAERLRRDGQWRGEFALQRRDGAAVPVESWITTVWLPSGPAYVGVLRDVAERQRFERLQEEFLSSLAHDLKNPLTTVRGQTQLLQRRLNRGEPPDEARLTAALESIDSAAIRMTKLLDELTDVMRLRAGQEIELRRESADLVDLTRRIVGEQSTVSELHQLRVKTEVDTLIGFWDGTRLERVLGNLLTNAIKYSPRGGAIDVRVWREAVDGTAAAVLSVADQGVGIPAGDLGLIFERFRRAGNVESIAGSGIGLAGAKRIVELHQGTISVTSAEGEGSTFTVRLPIGVEEFSKGQVREPDPAVGSG